MNTSGLAATTLSTAPFLRRKSGVRISIVVVGQRCAGFADHAGEMRRAAIRQIIAVDGRDDNVVEAELGCRLGNMLRLVGIERRRAARS